MSFLVPPRENVHQSSRDTGPERPSEFRESVEERTEIEAPADYPTPDQDGKFDAAQSFQPVEHGEPAVSPPVPVYQVVPPPDVRVFTDWQPNTMGLNGQPVLLAGANRRRTRLVVRNLDAANPVFLARQGGSNAQMGAYQLPPGQDVEIFHNSQVYAFSTVDGTQVTLFAEYDLDEEDDTVE